MFSSTHPDGRCDAQRIKASLLTIDRDEYGNRHALPIQQGGNVRLQIEHLRAVEIGPQRTRKRRDIPLSHEREEGIADRRIGCSTLTKQWRISRQARRSNLHQVAAIGTRACILESLRFWLIDADTIEIHLGQVGDERVAMRDQHHRVIGRHKRDGWRLLCCCLEFVEWQSGGEMTRIGKVRSHPGSTAQRRIYSQQKAVVARIGDHRRIR